MSKTGDMYKKIDERAKVSQWFHEGAYLSACDDPLAKTRNPISFLLRSGLSLDLALEFRPTASAAAFGRDILVERYNSSHGDVACPMEPQDNGN
jgi:hypothetical protein